MMLLVFSNRVIFRFQFSKNSRSETVFKRQSLGKFWALFHKKTIPSPFFKIRERGLRYQNSLMTNWFKFQCWKKKTTSFVDFKSTNNSNATSWVIGRGWCFCFFLLEIQLSGLAQFLVWNAPSRNTGKRRLECLLRNIPPVLTCESFTKSCILAMLLFLL